MAEAFRLEVAGWEDLTSPQDATTPSSAPGNDPPTASGPPVNGPPVNGPPVNKPEPWFTGTVWYIRKSIAAQNSSHTRYQQHTARFMSIPHWDSSTHKTVPTLDINNTQHSFYINTQHPTRGLFHIFIINQYGYLISTYSFSPDEASTHSNSLSPPPPFS